MKRFAVLFAAGVFLIPAAGCEDTGGGTTTPSPAATTTTPTPAPTGKASSKDSESAGEGSRGDCQSQRPEERSLRPSLSLRRQAGSDTGAGRSPSP